MNNIYSKFTSELITTKNDKAIVFEALSLLKDAAYMNDNSKFLKKIKDTVPISFYRPLELLISQSETPKDLLNNVIELEKYINSLPIAHITISYEPTKSQHEQLAKEISKKVSSQIILDYTVIPDYFGLKIEFGGKSYQKTIDINLTT